MMEIPEFIAYPSQKFRRVGRRSLRPGIYLILALAHVACVSPASYPTKTPPGTEAPMETIGTPTTLQTTSTLAPVTGTPSKPDTSLVRIEPFITMQGLRLRFDSWALNSQWIAYWIGEEDLPASLAFANLDSGEICRHEDVKAQDLGSGRVIWQEDSSAIAIPNRVGEAFGGVPCEAFAPVQNVTLPNPYTRVDLSPDGRYLAERIILELEGQAFHTELRITEVGTGQQIISVPYIDSPHFIFGGPRWLNNELFLIGKTVDQGVLYYSLPDSRVGNLFPDLLGLEARDEEYVSVIHTQANLDTGEYHLLFEQWEDTPGSLLYHSELDQIEDLPFYHWAASFTDASGGWSSFTPDGRWLLLLGNSPGGEDPDSWLRPVDPTGSSPIQIADQASPGGLSSYGQLMAFIHRGDIQIVSFPDGRLLGEWSAPNYDLDRLW